MRNILSIAEPTYAVRWEVFAQVGVYDMGNPILFVVYIKRRLARAIFNPLAGES